ncbi:MAG: helix-turn-helix domain-containing protein [Acidobacteriaceae bacterium]|nr:helix-turn-helix domain-containing protein [Acidobacteriaceae bacterium]
MNEILGQVIAHLRQDIGFSQEKLAEKAAIHRTYISQIERGIKSPTLTVLDRLSKALKTKPSQILRMVEEDSSEIHSKKRF